MVDSSDDRPSDDTHASLAELFDVLVAADGGPTNKPGEL
jgi:hypothetical protein